MMLSFAEIISGRWIGVQPW